MSCAALGRLRPDSHLDPTRARCERPNASLRETAALALFRCKAAGCGRLYPVICDSGDRQTGVYSHLRNEAGSISSAASQSSLDAHRHTYGTGNWQNRVDAIAKGVIAAAPEGSLGKYAYDSKSRQKDFQKQLTPTPAAPPVTIVNPGDTAINFAPTGPLRIITDPDLASTADNNNIDASWATISFLDDIRLTRDVFKQQAPPDKKGTLERVLNPICIAFAEIERMHNEGIADPLAHARGEQLMNFVTVCNFFIFSTLAVEPRHNNETLRRRADMCLEPSFRTKLAPSAWRCSASRRASARRG